MTDSIVERVARALANEEGYANDPFPYDERARAAIKAMREPTEAMMNVGSGFIYEAYGHGPTIAKEAWQAVVDEALK